VRVMPAKSREKALSSGTSSKQLKGVLEELVTANRILAHEGVVDGFGHVTVRHPQRPDRFLMSRARAPDCVEVADLMEFTLGPQALP
jgi:ribulose-5-phosphate 4-epimerase/fuculose-1-phosphate aldolase